MHLAQNKNGTVRTIAADDAKDVQAIYAPYVERTTISFETTVPTQSEMASRIAETSGKYPWIVFECDRKILGYAYASQHRTREAYRWSVDVAVYVDQSHIRQGVGRQLYKILLEQLQKLGYSNAFAGIALPNDGSVALHESFGFTPIGVYKKVGYKQGGWHDVGWWQKSFNYPEQPTLPKMKIEALISPH
ncbi:MAG: GNAT family N-acetyltransferase [Proteobacteria bacterium]|nr:GNAT family N-acetyltransferase [Pseudomonadota bacterium]